MIETIIYRWSAVCILAAMAGWLLPRLFRTSEPGFASATSAALLFMGIGLVAAMGAIGLLAYTARHFGEISHWAKVAGSAPFLLVASIAFIVWRLIRQ